MTPEEIAWAYCENESTYGYPCLTKGCPHCGGTITMTQEQLAKMYAKGYNWQLTLIGEPPVPPLCVKTLGDIGPLMREQYPTYRVKGRAIALDGSLTDTSVTCAGPKG